MVRLLSCDQEVTGSSLGDSLWQECKLTVLVSHIDGEREKEMTGAKLERRGMPKGFASSANSFSIIFLDALTGTISSDRIAALLVFPLKAELLKPPEQMERHITDLIKKSLQDVTGGEFKTFMDFLRSLSIFGDKAPQERVQELIEIIAGQADLDAQFNVSDRDHIDRLIACLFMAIPFFERGASNSKFLNYLNKHIFPVFDEAPNATNSLCGYKIVTGQPSDRLGEDFSENYKEFTERLTCVEELARATIKKLTQGMVEHNKAFAAAKSDEEKEKIVGAFSRFYQNFCKMLLNVHYLSSEIFWVLQKAQKQNTTTGLRTCNNILSMAQPLHAKTPSFIGDKKINLSWKELVKSTAPTTAASTGIKRPAGAINGSSSSGPKKGRGGGSMQNQLVDRAFQGLSYGGRFSRGRGRGRGFRGRGRGRGYH
ncbi:putative E3 ubiquitin-protein ligase ATL41-like [Capsicum annuum]|nr:putative E3 ubiquitin-protein ligase ATL41-like [Capsicum annuum]